MRSIRNVNLYEQFILLYYKYACIVIFAYSIVIFPIVVVVVIIILWFVFVPAFLLK